MRCVLPPLKRMQNKNLILSGRYEILDTLGHGNDGIVYLVRHRSLELNRALKQFPKRDAPSLFAISEAKILKTIQHPGIPTIYDFEEDESFFYLVEEYIQGVSLEEFLLHQQSISQNLFFNFCEQLCDIFAYLHTLCPNPIVYQDLKPEHIIVCGLQIKLIDFSVASFIANSGNDFNHLGNHTFSAPELALGGPVTAVSDIYSIGKIIQFMLPFVNAPLSRNILYITQKATNPEPAFRYQTVCELSDVLNKMKESLGKTHLSQNIAVIGSHSGCGCTHIAISLVSMLNYLGHPAVYQEENWTNCLRKALVEMEHIQEHDGCYYYQCFQGYPKYDTGIEIPAPESALCVMDYGCTYTLEDLVSADLVLYVCGGALWHRADAMIEDQIIKHLGARLKFVANLCDRNSAVYYARKISAPVYPYPFDTGIFQANENKLDFVHWLSLEKGRKYSLLHLIRRNRFFRHLLP